MKTRKFKISSWFIREELMHKIDITYDNESKRAYELLDIMASKYFKIDNRKSFNRIDVTEEEYQTWYIYFLEYYIDETSIYVGSKEEKESKRLLRSMIKFFGKSNFDMSHRAGAMMNFARALIQNCGEKKALAVAKGLKDQSIN